MNYDVKWFLMVVILLVQTYIIIIIIIIINCNWVSTQWQCSVYKYKKHKH
jgi:hypothetical protein